jgi:hypothetical protein
MMVDPLRHINEKREELIRQAEKQRLLDELPRQPSVVRQQLARACVKLAGWIEENDSAPRRPTSRRGSGRLEGLRHLQAAPRIQADWN